MNQLIHTPEHGHVWHTDCAKCGTRQKIRIGDCTLAEARSAISSLDRTPMECPGGFHTELGGWSRMWHLDKMLTELQRKEDAANEAAIGRDLQTCDLIKALGDDHAKAVATTHRKECFEEIRQMNERDGLNTKQTDEELLAELAEPVIEVQADVVGPGGPGVNLQGLRFTVPEYTCIWTVLHYHRGGDWVCQEPDHMTACNFQEKQILAGAVKHGAATPMSETSNPKSEIQDTTMPRFDALNPTGDAKPPEFPRHLAIRLMASPHECQVGPYGDHNAEFRRDVLEKLTGKRPPKAKAGCNLVRSTLAAHYGITDSTCGADFDNQIRAGLRRTIFAEFANTAAAFQQELRDISTIGGESIEKIYTLWCVYDYRSHDQSALVWEFKRQHAFDLGLTEEGTARERHTASPTPPSKPSIKSTPSKPSIKSTAKPTPQGDLIRKIPAGTFAFMASTPDGEAVRTAFAAWVDSACHTGDWRKLFATYQSEAVSLTVPAAAETPAVAEAAPAAPVAPPPAKRGPWSDWQPGTNVRFIPHDAHGHVVIGMLRDLVNDGDGAHIFCPRGNDTTQTLRVWERDGRMEAAPSRYHILVGKGAMAGVQSLRTDEIDEWNRLCGAINNKHFHEPDRSGNAEEERRILAAARQGKRLKVERRFNAGWSHLPEMFTICCGLEGDPGYDIGECRGEYGSAAEAQNVIRDIKALAAAPAKTPLMQEYDDIMAGLPHGTLLLYLLGDFYEAFGASAATIAGILKHLQLTKRNGVPMVGIPYHNLDARVALLVKAGKRVAIRDESSEVKIVEENPPEEEEPSNILPFAPSTDAAPTAAQLAMERLRRVAQRK